VPLSGRLGSGTISLVVRDATRTTRLVEVLSSNTRQMYNSWDGLDANSMPRTSRVVSVNRPNDGFGLVSFVADDYPIVRFAESHGLDMSYVTDADLDVGVSAVGGARALVFGAHTEYWTTGMRTNLEAALARGANAVFLCGNNMYWRPIPVGSARPYRELAIWKVAAIDSNATTRGWPRLGGLTRRPTNPSRPSSAISSNAPTCSSR
jgi:hypothetical protein